MTDLQPFLIGSSQTASSVRQIVDGATERWFFVVPLIAAAGLALPLIIRALRAISFSGAAAVTSWLDSPAKAQWRVNCPEPICQEAGRTRTDDDGVTRSEFDESDIEVQPRPPRDGGLGAARNTSMSGKGGV